MKKKLVFLLFLVLICIGIEYETKTYTLGELSGKAYGIIGLAALLALLYIVPASLIILHVQKKWKTPLASLIIAFLGGLFIAGWTSGLANTYIHDGVSTLSISFINDLESAIVAPLVEEPLKLIGVAFALYLVPVKNLKSILLLGIVTGFGFQISEDFSYILSDMSEGFSFAISGILGRVVGSIASHWLYTGLTAFGLTLMIRYRKKNASNFKTGLIYFLAAFILHFIWNSPLSAIETEIPLVRPILSALAIFTFFLAYQTATRLDNDQPSLHF
ncbi:PrsW family intramembrane metalloprotease [Streptococcus gordonii]|uniref:PrsW family intramembrane metalloprotease n=1 Tax=Streptococcus gordonii TaxID=1302 RepID=UPI000BBD1CE4|nr:PrsW family glutamic-type intramembrane protease [Streptococcus gordonii]ATF64732.1 PrsW family intramembrane metalloprotease [Streptococcus gordonii]MCY7136549.1 PrsW family glutamic-type intramembrane protease [Streptococcus gordonii]